MYDDLNGSSHKCRRLARDVLETGYKLGLDVELHWKTENQIEGKEALEKHANETNE